jgi:hypothetical protein
MFTSIVDNVTNLLNDPNELRLIQQRGNQPMRTYNHQNKIKKKKIILINPTSDE